MDPLARVLLRSQSGTERPVRSSERLWFAALGYWTHLLKHCLIEWHALVAVLAAEQALQFLLMLVVFWVYRRRRMLPQTVAERQLWAVWLGYILSCVLLAVIVKLQF